MARIAIIGAGAAGISAGRTLAAAGEDTVLFEARGRIGGRVHTDTTLAPHPIELGAEFVHGERVATWQWIREFGAPTTGAAHAYEMWFHLRGRLLDRAAALADFGTDPLTALDALTQEWQRSGRPPASFDRVLELWPAISPKPLTNEAQRLIENYIAELTSSDLADLGTYRRAGGAGARPETLRHFRLLAGYSSLIEQAATGLRIVLDTPVTRIRWDDAAAEVTAGDAVERFDRVIVTVPLGVLRTDHLRFEPALPAPKQAAIDRLNAGHISKVILRFDRVYWPPDLTFLWTPLSTQLWWRPGQGQAQEAPVLTAFFGGSAAAELEGAGEDEVLAEAVRQLEEILGRPLAEAVRGGRYVAWGREPHTWMGYSSTPPDGLGLREALAQSVGALAFAGEATSNAHPATVHGAIESGRRAAEQVIASLPG